MTLSGQWTTSFVAAFISQGPPDRPSSNPMSSMHSLRPSGRCQELKAWNIPSAHATPSTLRAW